MKMVRERRLAGEFRRQIYDILTTRIKDPRVTEMFGVQSVEPDGELKHAKVYISVFTGTAEGKAATFAALKEAAPAVRKELGARMHIRAVPELHFILDESYEYGVKIDKLLSGITYGDNGDPDGTSDDNGDGGK